MSYTALENQMRSIISNLSAGTEFFLRDIIVNPPAQLGRTLFEEVQSGTIPNVVCFEKVDGVEHYRKK